MKKKLRTFIHLKNTEICFEVTDISYYPNVGERFDFIQALDDKDLMTIYNLFDESLKDTIDKLYNKNKGKPLYGSKYNYIAKWSRSLSSFVVKGKTYEMRHSDADRLHFVVSILEDSMRKEL